ncbi:hypothetical protein UJ101_02244 [Flavobacteriaceae bacterium UJ101]|nr:hypothetical protein UJ101_02244 [Flavobacteriaceae bacterium UJ101]
MKKTLLALSIIGLVGLTSCKKTVEGAVEDTTNAVEATADAAGNAVEATGDAAASVVEGTADAVEGAAKGVKDLVSGIPTTGNEKIDTFLKEADDYFKAAKEAYASKDATKLAEISKIGQEFNKKQQEMAAEFQNLPADVQTKIGEYFTAKSNELMEAMKAQ